jgi:hypothetical protein
MDPMVKKEFLKKMHEDILSNVKRCYTTNVAKVTFIAGLLGLGSFGKMIHVESPTEVYYLVPLVAIFWDLIYFEQYISLTRITTFIRCYKAEFELEADWQDWVYKQDNRKKFFLYGVIHSTTAAAFIYSVYRVFALLKPCPDQYPSLEVMHYPIVGFGVLAALYC